MKLMNLMKLTNPLVLLCVTCAATQAADISLLAPRAVGDFSHTWTGDMIYDSAGSGAQNGWLANANPTYTTTGTELNVTTTGTSQSTLQGENATGGGASTWLAAVNNEFTVEVKMRVNDLPNGFRFWLGNDNERIFLDIYNDSVVTTNNGGGLKTVNMTLNDGGFHTFRVVSDGGAGNSDVHVWVDGTAISDPAGGVYNSGSNDNRFIFGDVTSGTFGDAMNVDIAYIAFDETAGYAPPPPPFEGLTWTANSSTTWDVNTTTNFDDGGPIVFNNGDDVLFDDTDTVGTVVLSGTIEPGSTTFGATTTTYTLSGDPLAGAGDVTLSGDGTVNFTVDNTYSGDTTISAGTLVVGNGGTTGSLGTSTVINNSSLTVNLDGTPAISNAISGSGTLEYSGPGTLTLSGVSSFTGGTTISGGGTVVLADPAALGESPGNWGGGFTVIDGTIDINGQLNYANGGLGSGNAETWLTTATVTVGGGAGVTPEIADTAGTPTGIAFAAGTALVYDADMDPGTATISAPWTQSGSSVPGTTRTVDVGLSAGTAVELDFTGGLGDVTTIDGQGTTIRKTGTGTMQISSENTFPRVRVSDGTLLVNHADALGADRTALHVNGETNRVTVDGTGTLDLNGFSPSIGGLADGGVTTGIITNSVATPVTLTVGSSGDATTYAGLIADGAGTTALTVEGGTLNLGGVQTYTGPTTVTGGLLRPGTLASAVTVQPGGAVGAGTEAASGSSTVPTLDLAAGSVNVRYAEAPSAPDLLIVSGSGGFTTSAISSIAPQNLDVGDTMTVIQYLDASPGLANLAPVQHGPYTLNDTGTGTGVGTIEITKTATPADTLIWVGNASGDWAVNGDSNWRIQGDVGETPTSVYLMDKVLFDDTADGTSPITVTLTADVTPETIAFDNSTLAYTLTGGTITTTGDFVKDGSAALTITGDIASGGTVTLNDGEVTINGAVSTTGGLVKSGTAALTVTGNIASAGPVTLNDGTVTINGVISGAAALTVNGGVVNVIGDCTYTGGTAVNAGTLSFGDGGTIGEIGFGATTVAGGATMVLDRSDATLDYNAVPKLNDVSGAGDIVIDGGGLIYNDPGTTTGFDEPNTWDLFTGQLKIIGDSEYQTLRQGRTALGSGTVVLGTLADGGSSGSLSAISGNWTWTTDISLVGPANKIINRATGSGRRFKLQGVISGTGGLTFEDATGALTNLTTGFILTGANTLSGAVTIPAEVPVRVGGIPGDSTSTSAGESGSIGTATIANEGILTFARTNVHAVDATISGLGNVVVGIGSGTATQEVTLNTVNTYEGTTTVFNGTLTIAPGAEIGASDTTVNTGGTLVVNGTLGDTGSFLTVLVNAGGTVGGSGSIEADIDISGNLAPGASVGTLAGSFNLAFRAGSSYTWEITNWGGTTPGTDFDHVTADTIEMYNTATPGEELTIAITPDSLSGFAETNQTYVIATAATTLTANAGFDMGAIILDDSAFPGTGTWAAQQTGLTIELVYTAGTDPYDNWAAANITSGPTGFDEDAEGDGLNNGLEWILNGNPNVHDAGDLVTTTGDATNGLTLEFDRVDETETETTLVVQWSATLDGTWIDVTIGPADSSEANSVEITVVEDGANPDNISVNIPASNGPAGKLFARLKASKP